MKSGDRVLDYVVDRELGEGGMGKVFLARHTVLDQQVAIKVLDPEVARKPDVRERFIQEANIQARLRHPGIVQVLTATQIDGGTPALIMEYVSGKSLSEVLEMRGSLPVDDALKIMLQVLSAVGYAHKQGVIHRDLKPSNVMVMANGETKVTDFGIAKVLGSARLTRTGTAMGSAHYMSPEQIRRPETVDARSDVYSLGCVFYEILTGSPPFGGKDASGTESDFEIKTAHINESAPAPISLNKNIPVWLDELIKQALEKEAGDRQASCEEIIAQIQAKETGTFISPRPPVLTKPGKNNFSAKRMVILAGAVVVGSLVFFGSSFTNSKKEKTVQPLENEQMVVAKVDEAKDLPDVPETTVDDSSDYKQYLEKKTIETINKLLSTWSESDEKAYAYLEYALAERIFFYGGNKSKKEILKQKLDFMGKWNFRHYAVRPNTLDTECDIKSSRCVITGVMDWVADSTGSNLHSEGFASFEYGVDLSEDSPKIYMESSKVLKRNLSKL